MQRWLVALTALVLLSARADAAGTNMTSFANQLKLAQVNDAAFTRGGIGLFAGTLAQPGVQIAFDNLKVSR